MMQSNSKEFVPQLDSRLWSYFNWLACLFFATFLVFDRAVFNLLAILLVIIAVTCSCTFRPRWDRELRIYAWLLIANLLLVLPNFLSDRDNLISFENPVRMLLMLPIILAVMRYGLKVRLICIALTAGIVVAALVVSWQYYIQGLVSPGIHYHHLAFSQVAMSISALLLAAGLIFQGRWSLFYLVGSLAGVYCVILSGARGTLLAIIPMAAFLLWWAWSRGELSKALSRHWALRLSAVLLILGALLFISGPFIQRVDIAVMQTTDYFENADSSGNSINMRLEIFRGAFMAGREHPLLGIGHRDFRAYLKQKIDAGEIKSYVGNMRHAHNDFLRAFQGRGVPGLLLQFLIYALPLWIFVRGLTSTKAEALFAALGGGLMTIGYATYSLTDVPMRNGMPLVFYIFTISLCIGIVKHYQSALSADRSH